MDTNNTNENFNRQAEEDFDIKDLLLTCFAKWRWFALSLLLLLSIAIYKVVTTHPTYSRYTDILIKSGEQGNMGDQMEKFASMGAFRGNTTVYNEIHAVQSPANVYEVVRRLNLDMNYECDGTFHKKVLYGNSLPVKATICDIPENAYAAFNMVLHPDGSYTLDNFEYAYGEEMEIDPDISVKGKLATNGESSDTIKTPIGRIHIVPSVSYHPVEEDFKIYVTRYGLHGTAASYGAMLSFALKDKDADVITISMTDKSTQRAEDVLNTVIEVYNERWVADKNKIATSTSEFINARLSDIARELENVDSIISTYKSRNLLPDVQAATSMYMNKNQKINSQIIDLNNELAITRYIQRYLTDNATKNQVLPAIQINNANISAQIVEYNRSMLQRNNLVASSSIENPLVKDLDDALSSMRSAIITSVNNQINALTTQIQVLEREERQTTERIAQNPTQSKFLVSEGRNQTVKEQLYLFLLQKREENELSKAFTAYNTRVITPPTGALRPVGPASKKIILIALVIGIMLPIGLILLIEFMDTKIHGRKELETTNIPIIGEIPLAYRKKRRLPWRKQSGEKLKVVVENGNRNNINEAFRILRTNIEFITKDSDKRSLIITSFNPGSGKSFITMNIGVTLALKGKKVLLIDGDMRHASLSTYVNSPKVGLSNYLAGITENIDECIVNNHEYKNLHILPTGTIPPNPTELLEDKLFPQLIAAMREKYDYVIIDCPPIDIVADASIIEKNVDRTIFIVRSGLLEKSMIPELSNIYSSNRFKNMSLILNGIEEFSGRYGHRYGYRYGYGYGYGYGYRYGYHNEEKK